MILITGANGQLGTELRYLLDERNEEYVAVDVAEMDITNAEMAEKVFAEVKPSLVYHCAAYTAVDAAEDEGKELDYAINVTGTENVAKAAEKHGATLVYISTDYVFAGDKPVGQEWEVDDQPDPQTEYGRTKRMGEELVEKYSSRFYIIRTAWVFGNYGKNFVFTMQNLAKTHKTLTVVNDQHGRPTWTRTLAEFMTYLAENQKEFGYYHLSNDATEDTTWYDFAVEILKDTDVEVLPVDSSKFPAKAKRPLNSTMSLAKAKATGFVIPTWQDALKEFYKGRTLLPNSFTANNRVEDIQAMYVPFWLFDSKVSASGSYQGASDSVYETDDEVITTTVVYNCEREGTMSFERIPVDGSEKMDDSFMESIEPFDYKEMVPFSTAYLTGFLADKYDVDAEAAVTRADARVVKSAEGCLADTVTGYTRVTSNGDCAVIKDENAVHYAMVPVWILSTRFEGKPYTFMMNGQTGKVVGSLPIDYGKLRNYTALTFIIVTIISYFIVKFML